MICYVSFTLASVSAVGGDDGQGTHGRRCNQRGGEETVSVTYSLKCTGQPMDVQQTDYNIISTQTD